MTNPIGANAGELMGDEMAPFLVTAAPAVGSRSLAVTREEAAWVAAARAGDEPAIRRLLVRYRPPLVRLLAGITGDEPGAEDLAQEAFLHAFRRLRQLREAERFYPWVRRLAVRAALRALKRRRRQPEPLPGELAATADPAAAQTRLAVRAVLAALSAELRATLVLREVEQLDYQEIAATLGIPVGTVRSRLAAAREQFRERWRALEAAE